MSILKLLKHIRSLISITLMIISIIALMIIIYRFGFEINDHQDSLIMSGLRGMLILTWILISIRFILDTVLPPTRKQALDFRHHAKKTKPNSFERWRIKINKRLHTNLYNNSDNIKNQATKTWHIIGYILFTIIAVISISLKYRFIHPDSFTDLIMSNIMVTTVMLIISLLEVSQIILGLLNHRANPSLILASSFACFILIGSLLLLLPNCHQEQLSFIDSLFIATSAVCVTGLSTVDISSVLTQEGLIVLLILIQVGGLGIMTITSFFGLFFMGGGSLSNQLLVSDLLSGEHINNLLKTLLRIIIVTLSIEAIGAVMIYVSISAQVKSIMPSMSDTIFFSIFHSVSAFCNAGFSTLSQNLNAPIIRQLSSFQYIICALIVIGGIGFPLLDNVLHAIKLFIGNRIRKLLGSRPIIEPRLWSLNSYIVIRMTVILITIPTAIFLILEWNHSLAEFNSIHTKISQAALMAITPRTAGFNGVNLGEMLPTSIIISIILMWIGGAPQSTAGGIKVTTFYLAFKNIFSGYDPSSNDSNMEDIKVYNRQISNYGIRRAFAVIILSISIISLSTIFISLLHPEFEFIDILFEVISALSTVGLSIGITPELSDIAKFIVIALMFIGRVGIVSLLAIFIRNITHRQYSYPQENILIN